MSKILVLILNVVTAVCGLVSNDTRVCIACATWWFCHSLIEIFDALALYLMVRPNAQGVVKFKQNSTSLPARDVVEKMSGFIGDVRVINVRCCTDAFIDELFAMLRREWMRVDIHEVKLCTCNLTLNACNVVAKLLEHVEGVHSVNIGYAKLTDDTEGLFTLKMLVNVFKDVPTTKRYFIHYKLNGQDGVFTNKINA